MKQLLTKTKGHDGADKEAFISLRPGGTYVTDAQGNPVVEGSLMREMQEVFDEPDEDKPNARLYRLVQRWTAEIHEAI